MEKEMEDKIEKIFKEKIAEAYEAGRKRGFTDGNELLGKYAKYYEMTMDGIKPEEASNQCKL
jgi:flagellar biosynthesis/type III secretory pathway protein FliH